MEMENKLEKMALYYASLRWPVLPLHSPAQNGLCSCGNTCASPGKHPRIAGGVHQASFDATVVSNWWKRWPNANIGVATGAVSGLLVIDLDERHDGIKSWESWEFSTHSKTGLQARTGGGLHLFYKMPSKEIKNRTNILPGIDVRANGGYVVAAGSIHPNGKEYTWIKVTEGAANPTEELLKLIELPQKTTAINSIFKSRSATVEPLPKIAPQLTSQNVECVWHCKTESRCLKPSGIPSKKKALWL